MKKLLVVLMVIAMASFLLVGCVPTTPEEEVPEEEVPVVPVVPATVAPIITAVTDIDITSTATQYVNAAEAVDGVTVTGTAPTYSEVKIYINGVAAGTADTAVTGVFTVVVANTDLIKAVSKVEGAKTLYATATEAGLAASAKSNEVKFTLDTVLPTITSSVGKTGTLVAAAAVTEVVTAGVTPFTAGTLFVTNSSLVVAGVWTVQHTGGALANVIITAPNGTIYQYTSAVSIVFAAGAPIPGVTFTTAAVLAAGTSTVTCVAPVAAVLGYIEATFNEAVTPASILASTWTAYCNAALFVPALSVRSSTVARLTEAVAGVTILTGRSYTVSCSGIIDLAGNAILAAAPSSSSGVIAP